MNIKVEKNVLLSAHTTLKVGGVADFFVQVDSVEELVEALQFASENNETPLILGGGSNILASDEGFCGLIIKNCIKGLSYTVHGDNVYLYCGSGEVLDEVVADAVSKNYWGLENLSSIPGTVGATPVQNVGAYGVEVSSLITEVSAINSETKEIKNFSNKECDFSYRDSFFKTSEGKKWMITEVVFKLSLIKKPQLDYGTLKTLETLGAVSIDDIRNEIIKIRSVKFPNWHKVGTAGSFFKNPVVSKEVFSDLQAKFPGIQGYPAGETMTKIPLGWVLDNVCNLRGFCMDGVCLYREQALVLVNESAKDAKVIEKFANYVAEVVKEKTGINIEREVTSV
ncbi:UDP-N-acetylmuramate dehydrogenase [Candidatus Nomurabacteria bacterium]|nr:UDP-N-acetylmuramate dehydrogenase [Candidatus Kaiserbacteria bacterium]MCB9815085.1 UDP-N-acetylmuramate dehydrogenase [Candidatus Nomurabacteria bacterium]